MNRILLAAALYFSIIVHAQVRAINGEQYVLNGHPHPIQHAQGFEIKEGQFRLNGKPMRIYGGEMHFARIPREYWRQRIQMAKAMGCNALSVYVFWNYHETAPGIWDWSTDNHDLRAFCQIAEEEGMYIILRPGPYTCAEWEFGGFPYWLAGTRVRTEDPAFLNACRTYLQQVFRQVDGLFAEQGGNILMTQVENEFGSFAFATQFKVPIPAAKRYMRKLADIYREVGFTHTLFTCDGGVVPVVNFARFGHIKGIFPGTNGSDFQALKHRTVQRFYDKKGPFYIPEEYPGWFTHWGDAHMFHRDVEKYKTHIEQLLKTDFSFCYYMVHGGTNFGFWNGSNYRKKNEVWPIVTSYDYGAPIDEAGNRTPLYDSLRAVYQRYTKQALPGVPAPIRSMKIDSIELKPLLLRESMPTVGHISPDTARTFEKLGQGFGYIYYENLFEKGFHGTLSTDGITDYALVYINDSLVAIINRNTPVGSLPGKINLDVPAGVFLGILIENSGRVNFGKKLFDNTRGPTKNFLLNGKPEANYEWTIFRLPMDSLPDPSLDYSSYLPGRPVFYTGSFALTDTADTYLDMHGFGKGVVFVNGHNLGRYWEIGPQYSLYLPGVWLRKGKNEIIIFDELNHRHQHYISATAKPVNN